MPNKPWYPYSINRHSHPLVVTLQADIYLDRLCPLRLHRRSTTASTVMTSITATTFFIGTPPRFSPASCGCQTLSRRMYGSQSRNRKMIISLAPVYFLQINLPAESPQ